MNQEQNNLNQNNFNTQCNNEIHNNQPLNNNINQGFNNTVMNFDPLTGQPLNQTMAYNSTQFQNYQNGFANNNKNYNSIQYATFGNRLCAFLKDCLYSWWIAFVVFFVIFIIKIIFESIGLFNDTLINILTILQISGPILFILLGQPLYAMVGDISKKHASKGKYKSNICVLDKNGNYLSLSQSFLRMLLKYLTIIIPFGLTTSIIMLCCTNKKQALHDFILGQVVIKDADKITNANCPKQNPALTVLAVIGVIVVGLGVVFLTMVFNFKDSKKLVCVSNEDNITIMYNDSEIIGYVANGISYDLDGQQEYAKNIGIEKYLIEFSDWFKNNTTGTCTIDGKEVSSIDDNELNVDNREETDNQTKIVGDDNYGYISIPNNWIKFYDVNGNDSIQYSYANIYIVSLNVLEDTTYTAKEYASNYMYNKQNDSSVSGVTGATVQIGRNKEYTAYQVYMYYPRDNTYLITYWFEAEDGKTHYIALEGPEKLNDKNITDYLYIAESFSLSK